MFEHSLDETTGVLSLSPSAALTSDDFRKLAAEVDPYIAGHGELRGLLLTLDHFGGWDSFAAMVDHMRFVRDHQRHVSRIAVVTDNPLLKIPPHIATHFAHPEIRVFALDEKAAALDWLKAAGA